jgi:hypothetical protein
MYLSFQIRQSSFTIFLITGIGDSNLDGSKLPCKVIFPPDKYLAFLGEQVQSTHAEARLLPISFRANQHPFQNNWSMICQSFDNLIDVFPREFLIINWNNIPPQESKPESTPAFTFFLVNIK